MEKITIEMELAQVEKIVQEEMKWHILNRDFDNKKDRKAIKRVLKYFTPHQDYIEFKRVAKARGLW